KITRLSQSSNREHLVPCEDVLLTKPEGIMQIPRNSHRTTMGCQWRLVAPLNHIIQLNIINFPMKPTTFVCHGHLRVYEGFGPGKKLIAHLHGSKKEFILISSAAYLTVHFKTDESERKRF
ncbi:OVCH1 isoform 2, partial [Pan troglodytes]